MAEELLQDARSVDVLPINCPPIVSHQARNPGKYQGLLLPEFNVDDGDPDWNTALAIALLTGELTGFVEE